MKSAVASRQAVCQPGKVVFICTGSDPGLTRDMATLNRVCERGMRYTFATSVICTSFLVTTLRSFRTSQGAWCRNLWSYVVLCCESECPEQHLASAVIVVCFEVVGKRDCFELTFSQAADSGLRLLSRLASLPTPLLTLA